MKHFFVILLLMGSLSAYSFDFSVENEDGVVIYYNITDDVNKTVEVTCKDLDVLSSYSDEYISIPSHVSYGGLAYKVTSIGNYAFGSCLDLKSVILPETVISIGNDAFGGDESIYSVNLPDGIITIGNHAFFGCSNLVEITIPSSVLSVGDYAFGECRNIRRLSILCSNASYGENWLDTSSLESIFLNCNRIGEWFFEKNSNIKEVVFGDDVYEIEEWAFNGCENLTSVQFGKNINSIGKYAFCGCGMKKIIIPESAVILGESVFSSCSSLVDVVLPNSLQKIPTRMFYCCPLLEKITLPNAVKEIGEEAFQGCDKIKSLILPRSLEYLGAFAFDIENLDSVFVYSENLSVGSFPFNYNHRIQYLYIDYPNADSNFELSWEISPYSIVFGDGVQSIGEQAFSKSWWTENIVLSKNIKSIGYLAFGEWPIEYKSIISYITEPFDIDAFHSRTKQVSTLYVPKGTKQMYEQAKGWEFWDIVEMEPEETTNISTAVNSHVLKDSYYSVGGIHMNSIPVGNVYIKDGRKFIKNE